MTATPGSAADLRTLMLASQRFRQAVADHFDLSLSETVVLGHLADAADDLTPRSIGERMLLSSGTLTAILDRLARRGYAVRAQNPADRRSSLIRLTPAGRRVVRFAEQRLERAVAAAPTQPTQQILTTLAVALDDQTDRLRARRRVR